MLRSTVEVLFLLGSGDGLSKEGWGGEPYALSSSAGKSAKL